MPGYRLALGMVAALLSAATPAPVSAAQAPELTAPSEGAVFAMSTPYLEWRSDLAVRPEAMPSYDVQIAADAGFSAIVDADRLAAVIRWYVPDKEFAPGDYWCRVAAVDAQGARGPWSAARKFSVRPPRRVLPVARGAAMPDVRRVLADAAAHAPATVQFEKGDYRIDPDGAEAFIDLADAQDLVVDGGGACVTFTAFLKFVRLERCRRVQIRNFTFDFDPLPYTAGRVVSVDGKAGTFEVEIAAGHPLPESNLRFEQDKNGMIVDPSFPRMKRGATLVFSHAGWQKLGERRYRFTAANRSQVRELAPGDVYVLDPRIATGFDVNGGDGNVFFNLVAHAVSNEAFNSHYANHFSILRCGLRLVPGRYIAANNGGHNHHNDRVGPWIEGGTWENTGDDICHVNCLVMGVEEKLAPDRVRLSLHNPYDAVGAGLALDIQAGDPLQFFNRDQGRLLAQRRVVRAEKRDRSLEVTLDGEVGDIVPGRTAVKRVGQKKIPAAEAVTQVFDAGRTCNQFVFRNNTVRNGRRVGVLAKGCGGLIENNTFEGLGGGAVEFWNAPFEGLGAVDYVVRGNRIRDGGLLVREQAAIWAILFKSGADRLHRNLLIADNEITGYPGAAILLRDAQNVVLRDNRIVRGVPLAGGPARGEAIVLNNTEGVRSENNTVREGKP